MRSTTSFAKILAQTVGRALPLLLATAPAFGAAKKAPPALDASKYGRRGCAPERKGQHCAEPCDAEKKCDFFRLPYVSHGLLPVRVIITNDSDAALSLDDARIQFISAAKDTIPAALPEDIHRRLFTKKAPPAPRFRLYPSPFTTRPSTRRSPRMTATSASTHNR